MDVGEIDREIHIKSKRPSDSNFKQQRLPAWQPVLTAGTVLPTFFVIGIAFIPIGITLLYSSNGIAEHIEDYTHCEQFENGIGKNITCDEVIKIDPNRGPANPCKCLIPFQLRTDFEGSVFMYYGLTNYYQNHRRYVKSRDDDQLLGEFNSPPSSDCNPFQKVFIDNREVPIVPCGAIANSLFNDTLKLRSESQGMVPVSNTGIAWPSDKHIKFNNPPNWIQTLKNTSNFARPIAWSKNLWELDPENEDNNGLQNEDLIVWMRTAALPSFRKLYRRVDYSKSARFDNKLPRGRYFLEIDYQYPVTQFGGTKLFILSTTSILGGKNPFLGYAYIVVGSICLVLGCLLLFVHLKYRNSSSSSTTSTTSRTPYT